MTIGMMFDRTCSRRGGFTLIELQVAIVLVAFGMVTLASLLATESQLLKRLSGTMRPGVTAKVTPSDDPWVRKLIAAARSKPLVRTAPPPRSADEASL